MITNVPPTNIGFHGSHKRKPAQMGKVELSANWG